jgi:hypothetical protein
MRREWSMFTIVIDVFAVIGFMFVALASWVGIEDAIVLRRYRKCVTNALEKSERINLGGVAFVRVKKDGE